MRCRFFVDHCRISRECACPRSETLRRLVRMIRVKHNLVSSAGAAEPAQQNCTVVRRCFSFARCRINREAACSRSETLRHLVRILRVKHNLVSSGACSVWYRLRLDSYSEQELRCLEAGTAELRCCAAVVFRCSLPYQSEGCLFPE